MQQFNSPNVFYLENTDFNQNYIITTDVTNPLSGYPYFSGLTVVMVQGNYCGYCTKLKPTFQQVADELASQGVDFATIQIDSDQVGEQVFKTDALAKILGQPLEGVPMLVKFYQGKVVDVYSGPHEYATIKQWIMA